MARDAIGLAGGNLLLPGNNVASLRGHWWRRRSGEQLRGLGERLAERPQGAMIPARRVHQFMCGGILAR